MDANFVPDHGWDGFREVEASNYEGTVLACLCGARFVEPEEFAQHLVDMGANRPGFEGRFDTQDGMTDNLARLYDLRGKAEKV